MSIHHTELRLQMNDTLKFKKLLIPANLSRTSFHCQKTYHLQPRTFEITNVAISFRAIFAAMTNSLIDRTPSLGHIIHRETSDNARPSTEAPEISISPTAAGSKMHFRSTLRAEAPEFKPRTSSLSATASEFKPCFDEGLQSPCFQKTISNKL